MTILPASASLVTLKTLFMISTLSASEMIIPANSPIKLNPSTLTSSDWINMLMSFKVALSLNKAIGLSMIILSTKLENSPMNVKLSFLTWSFK